MNNLTSVLMQFQDIFWLHMLVLLRVGPVMSLFPGIGETTVPVRIKLAMTLAFTAVVAPAMAPVLAVTMAAPPPFAWLALSEAGIGLTIGIGIRLFLLALQTCGSIAAQSTSLSQIAGSAGATPMPAIGHFLSMAGIALALMLDLHVRVAQMLISSYGLFPLGKLPDPSAITSWGIGRISHAFALAFMLAAPFVLVSVLYNLTLGIINRAMPQLMVIFVGAPVITGASLLLLMLLAPTMLTVWLQALMSFVDNPFGGR